MRFANTLVFGFALRNKEEWKKGRSGGPQKCVLYCFPNEEMASEAAGKCDCTLGYILYHSCRVGVGVGHNYWGIIKDMFGNYPLSMLVAYSVEDIPNDDNDGNSHLICKNTP